MKMPMKRYGAKGGSSSQRAEPEEPKMSIGSIMKDIEFLDSSHMTWKQKKDLENRKVISLGGKPQKKHRLPLSVARVAMKKQKEREEKSLQESAILGRFGAYFSSSSGVKHVVQKRQPENRVLRSTEGNFRNGVLDVKHLLKPSSAPRAPRADVSDDKGGRGNGKGKKKKKAVKRAVVKTEKVVVAKSVTRNYTLNTFHFG